MRPQAVFSIATEADADELAALMRAGDRAEIAFMHGLSPREGARLSLSVSDAAFAARINGRLFCLFGASSGSVLDASVCAWMLCSDEPERHPRDFLTQCREGFRLLADALPHVRVFTNLVYTRNTSAIRWMTWIGARFEPESENVPGAFGGEFKRFTLDVKGI